MGATYDGTLGMQSGADGHTERLYVPFLWEKGIISEPTFSFYFADESETSYMDFGTPNESVMKYQGVGEESTVWLEVVENDRWWTSHITGFYWGIVEEPTLYKIP